MLCCKGTSEVHLHKSVYLLLEEAEPCLINSWCLFVLGRQCCANLSRLCCSQPCRQGGCKLPLPKHHAFYFFLPHVPFTYKNKTTRQFIRRSYAEATARPDRKISRTDSMMWTHSKPCCTYGKDVSAWHWRNSTLQWNTFQSLVWDQYIFSWHRRKVGQIPHLPSCPSRFNTQRRCFKLFLHCHSEYPISHNRKHLTCSWLEMAHDFSSMMAAWG